MVFAHLAQLAQCGKSRHLLRPGRLFPLHISTHLHCRLQLAACHAPRSFNVKMSEFFSEERAVDQLEGSAFIVANDHYATKDAVDTNLTRSEICLHRFIRTCVHVFLTFGQ